jgi:hypothetical protein
MDALLTRLNADTPAITAIIAILGLGLLDWILGVARAIANSTFELKYIDVWVRTQLLGRILPIVLVLAFSQVIGSLTIGDFSLNLLFVGGIAAAGAYALVTGQSIIDSLNPKAPDAPPTE